MGYVQILDMISRRGDFSNAALVARLILLREVLGYKGRGKQTQFAAWVGIPATTWNNYECGQTRIRDANLYKLKRKTGVTSDWVYFGDPEGLPLKIARLLLDAEDLPEDLSDAV